MDTPVQIVVPTYEAPQALRRCLASIRRNTRSVPYRLNVADDGSGRATKSYLRSLKRRGEACVFPFERNRGKAAVLNRVLASLARRADWIVLLDDDAETTKGWLEGLLRAAARHPSASLIGCRVLSGNGRIGHAEMLSWVEAVGQGERDLGQRSYTRFCDGLSGTCMLARGAVFRKIRFWERLRQQYEDADFCLSARKAGLRALYCGQVAVRHRHLFRTTPAEFLRNRTLVEKKWGVPTFPDSHPLDVIKSEAVRREAAEDWRGMLKACRSLGRIDPVPAYAWFGSGVALRRLGQERLAREAFLKAADERCLSSHQRGKIELLLAGA